MTKRILVVDDDAMYIELVASLLAPNDVTIFPAPDGSAALKILESQSVDLIISDYNMPVMGGMELHRRVSGSNRFSKIPFVFITGALETQMLAYTDRFTDLTIILKSELAQKLSAHVDKLLAS